MRINHPHYGFGTVIDTHLFASGLSHKVRWDNGGPMASSDTTWERDEVVQVYRVTAG